MWKSNQNWKKIVPRDDNDVKAILEGIDRDIESCTAATTQVIQQTSNPEERIETIDDLIAELEKTDNEVQFAHESDVNLESSLVAMLQNHFGVLTSQMNEFRTLLTSTAEKLKEVEMKKAEYLLKVEELEDENAQLSEIVGNPAKDHTTLVGVGLMNRKQYGSVNSSQVDKRGDEIRKALLTSDENDGNDVISLGDMKGKRRWDFIIRSWMQRFLPFKDDIRFIQAKFGSSVVSYFLFYRFLFLQFSLISGVCIIFTIIHLVKLVNQGGSISTILSSKGLLPGFMMYSSFSPNEGFNYTLLVLVAIAVCCVTLLIKLIREDKLGKDLDALESENSSPYAKEVLCCWDFSLQSRPEVDDFSGNLGQLYLQMIEETKLRGVKKSRSRLDVLILSIRRFCGLLAYLVIQCISFGLILYLTINGPIITATLQHIPVLKNLTSVVGSICLSIINGITPMLLAAITAFEKWDSGQTEVNVLLFRMFLSNALNNIILEFSYILLANPLLLAQYPQLRSSMQVAYTNVFACRIDQASNGMFTLVLSNFIIGQLTGHAIPYFTSLYCKLTLKPFVRSEFSIADKMVGLLNFVGLILQCLPFAPLSILFVPIYLYLGIKSERYILLEYFAKPKRPWKAQKAGATFTMFYLATLTLIGIPACVYFISSRTFSKTCSIQDNYIHLCLDAPTTTEVQSCTTNAASPYYNAYGRGTGVTAYPGVLCDTACGPFVDQASALVPFKSKVFNVYVLKIMWAVLFGYPYVSWALVVLLMVTWARQRNTISVSSSAFSAQERFMATQIAALEAEKKKQARTIDKLKTIEGGTDAEAAAR